jgi:RNA polymerase sigma factor (sigma-70 family)
MNSEESFDEMMARLRSGDDAAAASVFQRFVSRLFAVAVRQFDARMRNRIDVEDIVLSAYKSFFLRNRRSEFDLAGWDELWSILAMITVRKCAERRRFVRRARRDVRREVPLAEAGTAARSLIDRAPGPVEAACLTELVEELLGTMAPDDRPVVERILMGFTAEEVALQLDCSERTVRRVRQRAKRRLLRIAEHDEVGVKAT